MTNAAVTCWYVVQTRPNAERKAKAHLERQGFEVYLPQYRKRRRHARRVEIVQAPLFPRYVFVAVDMSTQRWRSIQSTIGVSQLVCNGTEPAPVPPGIIQSLHARESADGLINVDLRPKFAAGDKVRILEGAFGDCQGLFESTTDGERVAILLDLLGRKVRVMLDRDTVAAA